MATFNYYTAEATRSLDKLAIEEHHIPGFELMRRAGHAAFDALMQRWPNAKTLIILCGPGNNGGDGFIIAGLAQRNGLQVQLYLAGDEKSIRGDALKALDFARQQKLTVKPATDFHPPNHLADTLTNTPTETDTKAVKCIIVDALLGTGLKGEVREPFADLIKKINKSKLPVLAVDIPSGLCSDSGKILGNAVKAELTVTFIGRKIGLILTAGPELAGELVFDDLGVPKEIYTQVAAENPSQTSPAKG